MSLPGPSCMALRAALTGEPSIETDGVKSCRKTLTPSIEAAKEAENIKAVDPLHYQKRHMALDGHENGLGKTDEVNTDRLTLEGLEVPLRSFETRVVDRHPLSGGADLGGVHRVGAPSEPNAQSA